MNVYAVITLIGMSGKVGSDCSISNSAVPAWSINKITTPEETQFSYLVHVFRLLVVPNTHCVVFCSTHYLAFSHLKHKKAKHCLLPSLNYCYTTTSLIDSTHTEAGERSGVPSKEASKHASCNIPLIYHTATGIKKRLLIANH